MTMRSASRRAADALRSTQDEVVDAHADASQLADLAAELHSVGSLLAVQPRLRRLLGDPATSPDRRTELAQNLFGGKLGDTALAIVKAAVAERWSSPWDLSDALEGAGDDALFAAAERDGRLDQVEDELFRLERILQNEGELGSLLDEQSVAAERRIALLDELLEGKVLPITRSLLAHAVRSDRKRSVALAIDDLLEHAAARQERSVARVISAAPISDAQQQRLTAALSQMYGRAISVRTALDPSLRGGLVVRVGDEVIDGSIATRFSQARIAMGV